MQFTAKQIADFIGGRVEGNEQATVSTFAKIEEAGEGAITFLSNPKYTSYIYDTKASIVLVNDDLELARGKGKLRNLRRLSSCKQQRNGGNAQRFVGKDRRRGIIHSLFIIP